MSDVTKQETVEPIVVAQPYHGGRFIISWDGGSLTGWSYPSAEAAQNELDRIRAALTAAPAPAVGEPVAWMARDQMRAITAQELLSIPEENGRRQRCAGMYPIALYARPSEALAAATERAEKAERERDEHAGYCAEAIEQRAAAEADLEKMRRALGPFSLEADNWHDDVPDDYCPLMAEPGAEQTNPGSEAVFLIGDLRRAREALSTSPRLSDAAGLLWGGVAATSPISLRTSAPPR